MHVNSSIGGHVCVSMSVITSVLVLVILALINHLVSVVFELKGLLMTVAV